METLKTIRLQLAAVEEAYREKRLREVVDTLVTIHDLIDVLAAAFLSEQVRAARGQIERLAELGLVTADLEAKLEFAQAEPSPQLAAEAVEEVWESVREMLEPAGKLLLRTNIFPRGKKTLLRFDPGDTLRDVARILRRKYARQIEAHLKSKGVEVVIAEAVDIFFYGAKVWEDPDEAMLSEHTRVSDLISKEAEGIMWFPVLPGDSPILFDEENEDGLASKLLEHFTIETDVNKLEEDVEQLAADLAPEGAGEATESRTRAFLIRAEGTDREERIPLVGEHITLGRGRENDIQILNDIKVSRFHCRLTREHDSFYVEDNGSSNGTLIDGEASRRRELLGGEVLGIGNTLFRFIKD